VLTADVGQSKRNNMHSSISVKSIVQRRRRRRRRRRKMS